MIFHALFITAFYNSTSDEKIGSKIKQKYSNLLYCLVYTPSKTPSILQIYNKSIPKSKLVIHHICIKLLINGKSQVIGVQVVLQYLNCTHLMKLKKVK